MGKKSLIKSTAKKKPEAQKEGEKTTQKAAAKTKKAPAKATKKSSSQAETKKKAVSITANADKSAPKSKPVAKKLSVKELTFLKFEALTPAAKKLAAPKPAAAPPTAPPLIDTNDAKEAKRLHALLAKRFNMDEIKASAKAPTPQPPAEDAPKPEMVKPKVQTAADSVRDDAPKAVAPKPAPKSEQESAYITIEPSKPEPQADPVSRSIKIAAAAAGLLIFILLAVSANNSGKYYIKPKDNAIEIWKGDFSPKDKSFYMVLHGAKAPETEKAVYSKEEVYPLIFNYYIDKSDTLLEVKGLPDFEGIKKYLHKAEDFAVTNDMKMKVNDRLNTIERMILLYKADVAFSRNTEESLESAIKILKDAGKLSPSDMQAEEISQKIEAARERINTLKTEAAAQPTEKQ